ncbi:MAG: hypothetical protein FWH11_10585 [Micrococcales bacterium]|nr:hypothetical protein [Micrococcales bacterium]
MTYTVHVTREDRTWLGEVPDLPGAHTFAASLSALDRAMREVVVLAADLPDGAEATIDLVWDLSDVAASAVEAAQIAQARAANDQTRRQLAAQTRRLVLDLVGQGWSARDVATVLGLSPGRVSQITRTTAA